MSAERELLQRLVKALDRYSVSDARYAIMRIADDARALLAQPECKQGFLQRLLGPKA